MGRVKTRAKRMATSKWAIAAAFMLVQLILVFGLIITLGQRAPYVYLGLTVLSVFIPLVIFDDDSMNPSYKLLWLILVAAFPVGGVLAFLFFGNRRLTKKRAHTLSSIEERSNRALVQQPATLSRLQSEMPKYAPHAMYLQTTSVAPVYTSTETKYFENGEKFFAQLCEELEKAERFILMEYYIIEEGHMWNTILGILRRKAAAGVKISLVYDGFGCVTKLPSGYDTILRTYGIDAHEFNPIALNWHITDYMFLNHRDHRKICVIDGNVGFNGGLNLADEYINTITRFGYWKDTAYMLRGPAVYTLTVTFSKIYQLATGSAFNHAAHAPTEACESDGFVQPFDDTPLDGQAVSEYTYLNVINRAERYIYITTPYLVVDNEMLTALRLAAQSGVDVRVVTPGIPDKVYVYWLTQSYYSILLRNKVRIFEYTPGFMHAKMFVADDEVAIVGSANLDYRSLYLHFESSGLFYGGSTVAAVKADFDKFLPECREITLRTLRKTPIWKRMLQILLRFFAPLM